MRTISRILLATAAGAHRRILTMRGRTFVAAVALGLALAGAASSALADDRATKDEAVAMVKKGIALVKSAGPDKAYAAFDDKANADFHVKDLYLFAYNLEGTCLAHGTNPKLVGQDMNDAQDSDGVYYIKERMKLAKAQASFWQDYKFTNPISKKIEPKTSYCERVDASIVCGGIYK